VFAPPAALAVGALVFGLVSWRGRKESAATKLARNIPLKLVFAPV
jgi:hypothetical protein